ncbi:MAG: hypothetical protein EZS28_043329, partial [Streblomastix strix]
ADSESFSEDGIQRQSLWILKTGEGSQVSYTGKDQPPNQCLLTGTISEKPYSLFVPVIDETQADESKDKYGADITIKGSHFVRCGMMQYEICENKKPQQLALNEDLPPTEEEAPPDPHEEHCQRRLMENALDWRSEQEIVIQTRYKVVRKWKKMDVRIIYGEFQTTETFTVSTEKLTTGILVAMILGALALVGAAVGLLVGVVYCNRRMKAKNEEDRRNEDQEFMLEVTDPIVSNETGAGTNPF